MPESFALRLRKWRGQMMQKEAASILDVPIATLRKWEYGKRTPNKITLCELERRMAGDAHTLSTLQKTICKD